MRVICFFDCLPFSRAAIPAATVSPAASQKSTGKTAFYGPCKIRDAGRRPNRPPGGFSGRSPLAPASPGRPAARSSIGSAPLLRHLPLPLLYPREVFLERKPTSIADKIAGTTPPCLSQKLSNIIANNLRFSREPLFERSALPTPSLPRGGLSLGGHPPLRTTLRGEIYPNFQ